MGNTTSNTINEATNVVNSIISTVVNTTNQNAVSTITGRQVNSLQISIGYSCLLALLKYSELRVISMFNFIDNSYVF